MMEENTEDPMLSYREFFNLRNHDDTDTISAIVVGEIHVVSIELFKIIIDR